MTAGLPVPSASSVPIHWSVVLDVRVAVGGGEDRGGRAGAEVADQPHRLGDVGLRRVGEGVDGPGEVLAAGVRHGHVAGDDEAGDRLRRQDQRLRAVLEVRGLRGGGVIHTGDLEAIQAVEGVVRPLHELPGHEAAGLHVEQRAVGREQRDRQGVGEHGHVVGVVIGHGQVQTPVAVEVADGHRGGATAAGIVGRGGGKRPAQLPQQHAHVVATLVGHGEVREAVAVEVADGHGAWEHRRRCRRSRRRRTSRPAGPRARPRCRRLG